MLAGHHGDEACDLRWHRGHGHSRDMVICGFLSILDPILGPMHLDNDIRLQHD